MSDLKIALPDIMNFIYLETDGTIWVSRHDRKLLAQKENSNVNTFQTLLGITQDKPLQPKRNRLPDVVPLDDKPQPRFLNKDMEVVTKEGRPYKELIIEKLLSEGVKK